MPSLNNPEGDQQSYDPQFPSGLGSWRKTSHEDSTDTPVNMPAADNQRLNEHPKAERRYPQVALDQEIDLLRLEKVLNPGIDPDTSWVETVTVIEHTGPWGSQIWRSRDIERNLDPEYKEILRRKTLAKLYEGLMRDPVAEALARQIIAENPLQPID